MFRSTARASAASGEESTIRTGFKAKIGRLAAVLPFAEDLLAAYFCAFDGRTPSHVRAGLLAAIAYFVMPLDAIPDIVAGLGYTDDAAVLFGAIKLVASHIQPIHRQAARRALRRFAAV